MDHWLEMVFVTMRAIQLHVTLMAGTAVDLVQLQYIVQNACALVVEIVTMRYQLPMEMEFAMMKPIMQSVIMMVVTVVYLLHPLSIVRSVHVPLVDSLYPLVFRKITTTI